MTRLTPPATFAESVSRATEFVIETFNREIETKQLYYHNHEHIEGVQNRALRIFEAVRPYWKASEDDLDRMQLLVKLCAIAHDMIQIFLPQTEPCVARRRESGVSETATLDQLLAYIAGLNERSTQNAQFTEEEIQIIRQAISATICSYHPDEQAIYQPDLAQNDLHWVARIVALADIGTLAMEGVEAYNREGSLLFLEENPDILALIETRKILTLETEIPTLYEMVRQRLLRRTQFQVSFARSRLNRLPQELIGLPTSAIAILMQDVFRFANRSTLQTIMTTTPTAANTLLNVLLDFFQFK